MSLRKASSYSKQKARPYTRKSRDKSKAYIKVIPNNKIVRYNFGEIGAFNRNKFKFGVSMIADQRVLIRDNALESGRMQINKTLEMKLPKQFYFGVKVYPHHILRNNKAAAGAGADRISTGMTQSFGVVEGRAAIVNAGQTIFFIATETEQGARVAREALTMVKAKIPCRTKVLFGKLD